MRNRGKERRAYVEKKREHEPGKTPLLERRIRSEVLSSRSPTRRAVRAFLTARDRFPSRPPVRDSGPLVFLRGDTCATRATRETGLWSHDNRRWNTAERLAGLEVRRTSFARARKANRWTEVVVELKFQGNSIASTALFFMSLGGGNLEVERYCGKCRVRDSTHLATLTGERAKVEAGRWLTAHLALLIHLQQKGDNCHYARLSVKARLTQKSITLRAT